MVEIRTKLDDNTMKVATKHTNKKDLVAVSAVFSSFCSVWSFNSC